MKIAIGSICIAGLIAAASAQQATDIRIPFDEVVGPSEGPGSCPQVDWPLHLVGVSHVVASDTVANGVHHLVIQTGIHGDATDAAGNTFVFAYQNHVTDTFDPQQLIRVVLTDQFNLEGQAAHLHQGFVLMVTTDSSGNLIVDFKLDNEIGCDPI